MNSTTLVTLLYWASLTYHCLNANWRFATAIHQAIRYHDAIRQQARQELDAYYYRG